MVWSSLSWFGQVCFAFVELFCLVRIGMVEFCLIISVWTFTNTHTHNTNKKRFAVRCAWLETGGSPYLASLRMDQAKNWQEFREACSYSNIPGENMIWADVKGDIGWQAVGIAPIRKNFSGLVPVLGNGKYEWSGYLPIVEKPNSFNPKKGFIATANQNLTPSDYKNWDAIGFTWSDPYRGDRVNEFLGTSDSLSMGDMKKLQVDVTSLPAKSLVPYLEKVSFKDFENKQKSMNPWLYSRKLT